ncbi:hypothetical protein B5C34_01930 [Pacificimonas flava]|uniref:Peptidase M19 n=2 Tax=Pacificimonas TaxID=1960290 RepID=A0A219B2I1_9SPHN|nr:MULTISPECIES: membrane dipeptidase [Pacificimonas]MBZ6378022.1 membrane dipeptidase [Pacificimonas aurantium]OWV32333.1 hypothetical protein B5C34_01930 [Pacificimonas flava]
MIGRRDILKGAAAAAAMTAGPAFALRAAGVGDDWFERTLVIDGLGGIWDPYREEGVTRTSDRFWSELQQTGVDAVRITVYPVGNRADGWARYQESIAQFDSWFAANPDRLVKIRDAAGIAAARKAGKVGVILGTQDSSMIGPDLDRLAAMKADGVMTIQLTYNNRNLAGDGSIEPDNAGLSKLGRATIERIESEKLLLDLSHGGARTMTEAVEAATRPLVISHTGARALADHPRNASDETIRAVADKGGVVGLYFMPYLAADMQATSETVVAHADHLLRIAGEDHIGVGTDNGPVSAPFDAEAKAAMDRSQQERLDRGIAAPGEKVGVYPLVEEYYAVDRYERFASDLAKRGWSERQLDKLLGQNFLRVYGDAWGA